MSASEYAEVGYVLKTFGLKGALKVKLLEQFEIYFPKINAVFFKNAGQFIPYFIDKIQDDNNIVVSFEDIKSPEAAKLLIKQRIYVSQSDLALFKLKDNSSNMLAFIGYEILQNDNAIGSINSIENFPQQLMAIIERNDGQLLIPLIPEFIMDINHMDKKIHMNLPEGLIDL